MNVREVLFLDDVQEYVDSASDYGWHTIRFRDAGQASRELCEYGVVC